ncbi:IQ DOMAIN-CONTAINING PROTEIN IQM3 [Salix koriyanagi]|uniref:IQ DOMAIN-CONTAINING PROTEIN IQM3 n=1 Tax=Salix koriyanagi TaxID=2511006 RepID=A0A9Q0X6C7_9ROSI|nr:IQ DOMAIN-CONTAINING PROTEIN IQM3 [Salix koriyanagi]
MKIRFPSSKTRNQKVLPQGGNVLDLMLLRWARVISKTRRIRKTCISNIGSRHRYGAYLYMYFKKWSETNSGQPFFYWLDVGDGKEVEVEECPRSKLQENSIKYLGPKEREQYECIIIEGKFFHKQSRNLVDTKGKWIFVLSPTRRLYAGQKKRGKFHHSSFVAGGATIAAGTVIIEIQ